MERRPTSSTSLPQPNLKEKLLKVKIPQRRSHFLLHKNPVQHNQGKKTKTRPNQLIMMNIPESFKPTKSTFFTHIRIIWGLIYQKSVAIAPNPSLLKELYNWFDHVDEIQQVTNSTTAIYLIPEADIITLRGTKPGSKKTHPKPYENTTSQRKLNDKRLSEKYWEQATQKYDLSHEIHGDDSDESESDSEDIESSSSSGIGSLSNEEGDSDSDLDDDEIMEEDSQMETSQTLPAQIIGTSSGIGYGYDWENWQ
ncbi:hypothetical protein O181_043713 [Austropuccinia psidii MF-1]|uniref:Uncharacterized protein n=1 Tax=Austropuccinia psidii MF-1 TaxID=1389203 RepID=A0A9Q3DNP7_9BASI|nr:hypothetical protein [Austropuccinia psidii MF-1]